LCLFFEVMARLHTSINTFGTNNFGHQQICNVFVALKNACMNI
jgi:hypothetical protein